MQNGTAEGEISQMKIQGVREVKANISGISSTTDSESKTSYTHGSNSQRFRSCDI